jgi:hypothetical protein
MPADFVQKAERSDHRTAARLEYRGEETEKNED